jgi:hypothetical protein
MLIEVPAITINASAPRVDIGTVMSIISGSRKLSNWAARIR